MIAVHETQGISRKFKSRVNNLRFREILSC